MTDVLVVGGGPAGAAAAIRLAETGASVTVLERDTTPMHKVCGEFISGEAVADLADLGVDLGSLGAAPIARLRLVGRVGGAETALPFAAAGLSRRVLDAALLARAAASGARVLRGQRVQHLAATAAGVTARAGGMTHRGGTALLASGKHDVEPHRRVLPRASELVGFKLHLRLPPAQRRALEGRIELILFRDGYAGLQPIEEGLANLCLMVRERRLRAAGGWDALRVALLAENAALRDRLRHAEPLMPRPMAIARVPYGFLYRGDGQAWRLGDQMAVIPSFSGDGMAIALNTARRAAAAFIAGQTAAAYHAATARALSGQIRLAMALQRLGHAEIGQDLMVQAGRLLPGLLRLGVRATRVPALSPA